MRLPDLPADNRYRVLVAEDDASIGKLLVLHIKKAGFEAFLARDGLDAWSQFTQVDPHLVLTDINMPGMSGHELVEKVRGTSAVPILMMTAADSEASQMQGFRVGADDYIPKPFNPTLLMARVVANLRRVYRYDAGEVAPSATRPSEDEPPSMGLPAGFARCEACGYLGPVWKFDARDSSGHQLSQCPNCRSRQITFTLA